MGNLEEFKSVVKELVNNEIVVSAVIIEASLEKVRVQRLKGEVEKVENFKEILDETCPDWEHTENII
jgi:3-deoxy-D-arabino-heptulosonate 7-phosphate (DAHP) synthase